MTNKWYRETKQYPHLTHNEVHCRHQQGGVWGGFKGRSHCGPLHPANIGCFTCSDSSDCQQYCPYKWPAWVGLGEEALGGEVLEIVDRVPIQHHKDSTPWRPAGPRGGRWLMGVWEQQRGLGIRPISNESPIQQAAVSHGLRGTIFLTELIVTPKMQLYPQNWNLWFLRDIRESATHSSVGHPGGRTKVCPPGEKTCWSRQEQPSYALRMGWLWGFQTAQKSSVPQTEGTRTRRCFWHLTHRQVTHRLTLSPVIKHKPWELGPMFKRILAVTDWRLTQITALTIQYNTKPFFLCFWKRGVCERCPFSEKKGQIGKCFCTQALLWTW